MKLQELLAQEQEIPAVEPPDDDEEETGLIADEDFWEAIELLEECVVEMDQALNRLPLRQRTNMAKQIDDVREFISLFVVGVEQ